MKLRWGLPKEDCPDDFERAILLRVDPTQASHPTKRVGWNYLNLQQIQEFLPFSMRCLLPHE